VTVVTGLTVGAAVTATAMTNMVMYMELMHLLLQQLMMLQKTACKKGNDYFVSSLARSFIGSYSSKRKPQRW
jgi:hypothetical protein